MSDQPFEDPSVTNPAMSLVDPTTGRTIAEEIADDEADPDAVVTDQHDSEVFGDIDVENVFEEIAEAASAREEATPEGPGVGLVVVVVGLVVVGLVSATILAM